MLNDIIIVQTTFFIKLKNYYIRLYCFKLNVNDVLFIFIVYIVKNDCKITLCKWAIQDCMNDVVSNNKNSNIVKNINIYKYNRKGNTKILMFDISFK